MWKLDNCTNWNPYEIKPKITVNGGDGSQAMAQSQSWRSRLGERKRTNKQTKNTLSNPSVKPAYEQKDGYFFSSVKLEIKPKCPSHYPLTYEQFFLCLFLGEGFACEQFNDKLLVVLSAMYDFVTHKLQMSSSPFALSYIWIREASFGNNIEVPYLNLTKSNKYNHNS